MQIIAYTPTQFHGGSGHFELPIAATLHYLQQEIGRASLHVRLPLYRELCSFRYTDLEWIDLDDQWQVDLGYVTATLLDHQCAVAYCPTCQTYFTSSQIRAQAWDDGSSFTGRRYACSQDHPLLIVKDTQYFTFPF